jgi:hypothetical protein
MLVGVPAEIRTDHFRIQVYSVTATLSCAVEFSADWNEECGEDYRENLILVRILHKSQIEIRVER